MEGARALPVVLALVLGLLGMHALVAIDAPQPAAQVATHAAAHPLSEEPTPVSAGPAHPGHQHPATHHALHLCLAVLGALLVLLVGLVFVGRPAAPDGAGATRPRRGRRAPPRPPPTTSVRLARLCVLRT